jgi:MraZ protein
MKSTGDPSNAEIFQGLVANESLQEEGFQHRAPRATAPCSTGEHTPEPMTVFLASYLNGVDRKGRVSVPASFRAEMVGHSRQTVVVYPAPAGKDNERKYLHAWAYDDFVKLAERINRLPALSPTRQRLARTLLAAARPLNFDDTGRIQVPEAMLKEAGIDTFATIAGEGEYFSIWNPQAFDEQVAADSTFADADLAELHSLWQS